jgi:hypothetical protein
MSTTTHLPEETLILHYYSEADDAATVEAHLAGCAHCRTEFERLRRVLALVDVQEVPGPGPAFERRVWARLAPELETRRTSWFASLFPAAGPRWVYAGGVAALLLVAFIAGRFSSPGTTPSPASATTASAAEKGDVSERVLVVAVVDHLDRSQMMLVELLNADPAGVSELGADQSRARELINENRLYRVSAEQAGDEAMTDVLDDLERVLLEIANTPRDASAGDLEALRQRINARGLLFKVRVVHSEMRERERQTVIAGSTS